MEKPNKIGNGISSTTATSTSTTTTSSDDSTVTAATSSTTVDVAVELDGCCFVLSVADAHNTGVGDRSAPFCIAGSSAEATAAGGGDAGFAGDTSGGGDDGGSGSTVGSSADNGATLEVIKFPSGRWEIGTVQEVRVCRAFVARGRGGAELFCFLCSIERVVSASRAC